MILTRYLMKTEYKKFPSYSYISYLLKGEKQEVKNF